MSRSHATIGGADAVRTLRLTRTATNGACERTGPAAQVARKFQVGRTDRANLADDANYDETMRAQ